MYNIGDKIEINICLDDLCYTDNMMISYIVDNLIVTCGHCLPENSKIKFGKILYTSGFDNLEESKEIAIIEIYDKYKKKFNSKINNKVVLINNSRLSYMEDIFLINCNKRINGKILRYIDKKLNLGVIRIYEWKINHVINKLSTPFILAYGINLSKNKKKMNYLKKEVKKIFNINVNNFKKVNIYLLSKPSYSGSPWLLDNITHYKHVGMHIGKTIGIYINGNNLNISEIAYIRPI